VKGVLADVNMEKQARILVDNICQNSLAEIWRELGFFSDHGLKLNLSDRDVWRFCQENGWVLLTENRNQDGKDSLEQVIADEGLLSSLPVLTVSKAALVLKDSGYRREVANSIVEYLIDIDIFRGAGRLYLPRRT